MQHNAAIGDAKVKTGDGRWKAIRGISEGKKMYVKANNGYTAEQIAKHEYFHQAADERVVKGIWEEVKRRYEPEVVEELKRKYEEGYEGCYEGGRKIEEEIAADVYSGMNVFEEVGEEIRRYAEELLEGKGVRQGNIDRGGVSRYDGNEGRIGKEYKEESTKNIKSFLEGKKSFNDVLNDYAELYTNIINSNEVWSWSYNIPGGTKLTKKQRYTIKQYAIKNSMLPSISVVKIPGLKQGFADFKAAGLVKETVYLPESKWKLSDAEQFKWLDEQIGGPIKGYTWHHTEVPGKMELIPMGIHNIIAHNGGRTTGMWAGYPR